MDLKFPFSFTSFALFLSLVLFFLTKLRKNSQPEKLKNLPPAPRKLPIIGHLHLVSSLPHRSFKDLAEKYGPMFSLKLGEDTTIVISSRDIVKEVLKTQDPTFANRVKTHATEIMFHDNIDVAFSPYGEYWKQMRRICASELLSPNQVKSFRSIRSDEIYNVVKSIRLNVGTPVNLTKMIYSSSFSIIARAAFGKIYKGNESIEEFFMKTESSAASFDLADLFPSSKILKTLSRKRLQLLAIRRKLDRILDAIIDEHRENLASISEGNEGGSVITGNGELGNKDFVDVFLRQDEGAELEFHIHNDNIKAVLSDFFTVGVHTTSTIVDWAMVELMRNPKVMAKAQAEIREILKGRKIIDENDLQNLRYLKLVIKETFRLHPPLPLIPRTCREDCEINGYFIPANAKVFIFIWGMGRDYKYWDNPERFEPERFENNPVDFRGNHYEFLPFGAGKRMCPGMSFAIAGVDLLLAQLLYNFDWKLPNGIASDDLNMEERFGMTLSRKENLRLIATPYHPSSDGCSG